MSSRKIDNRADGSRATRTGGPQDGTSGTERVIIVAALALVIYCLTNLPWQLDDYDQAKQAFTSFEMVKEGHWLYQRTPHERVATKPPLVGWTSAASYEVTRSWDVAWRLPSLGAAIALSILLYRAGNVYGASGGLIALSAFAFNLLTPRLASLVRTDMPLALLVFAIGLTIWNHLRERREWRMRDQLSIFALLTAAMLIKGPIVYAFLLPAVAIFWWRGFKIPWWPWVVSLGIFAGWVAGGCILVPNFYDEVIVREFLGRFGETVHHPQPIYFYLPHLLHKFAPWSLLMVALAIVDLRARKDRQLISPETMWLICWSLGGLVVMSLIPSKRVDRIFPVIPPLCLLVAVMVRGRFHQLVNAAVAVSILYAGVYGAARVFTGYSEQRDALVKFGANVRTQAAANQWHTEVVNASDEGLLLYLDKLRFVRPDEALARWNRRELDALVAPVERASLFPEAKPRMTDARGRYVLLTH